MNARALRFAPLTLALALLTSCAEVGVERWEGFDYPAFKDELDSPTGELSETRLAELLEQAKQLGEAVRDLDGLADQLRRAAELVATRAGEPVSGTNLFARISCPGPNLLEPDFSFEYGVLEVESPGMLLEAAVSWKLEEDVLITAKDCVVGAFVVRGESPGWIDPVTKDVALDVNFEIVNTASGAITAVDLPIAYAAATAQLLVFIGGDSYTLEFGLGSTPSVGIVGADVRYVCELDGGLPSCVLEQ